jgi:threonine dehydratase
VAALPVVADARLAAEAIRGVARRTPLVEAHGISEAVGRKVLVKPETLQLTGSFKFRGAYSFLSRLDEAKRGRGVVAYSSGNHAQGVAVAAAKFGVSATLVMPADAPETKTKRVREAGGAIVTYDREHNSREEIAASIAADTGAALVPPFDHAWTIAGQATVGLEIAADCAQWGEQEPTVLVPCSGGGLAAGIAIALEADLPGAEVHVVEPAGFDVHARSLASGRRERLDRATGSISDGLLAPEPGEITFEINKRLLRGAHAVSDDTTLEAMALIFDDPRLVAEPSGAVGVAALLEGGIPGSGTVVVVLSGGNADRSMLHRALG